jgi:hypothetical protein
MGPNSGAAWAYLAHGTNTTPMASKANTEFRSETLRMFLKIEDRPRWRKFWKAVAEITRMV